MATVIGNVGEFDSSKEEVIEYIERFELFLAADDIVNAYPTKR